MTSPDLPRRSFLKSVGLSAMGASLGAMAAREPDHRPNFLFLFTDDQRADAAGYIGNSVIQTPALDALAEAGTVFTNSFVTTSICCVSRVTALTGQFARRHGINDFVKMLTSEQFGACYPQVLRRSGYYVGFIGKWGIGANNLDNIERASHEFDYWAGASHQTNYWHEADCPYVTDNGTCTCPPDGRGVAGPDVRVGHANMKDPVHLCTDIVPDKVAAFLEQRPKNQPFCLSVSLKWAHGPWSDWHPRFKDTYNLADMPIPLAATPEEAEKQPDFLKQSLDSPAGMQLAKDHDRLRRIVMDYYRLIATGDYGLMRIRKALEDAGAADNTVILFSSDNGQFLGEHGLMGKWLMHEESIRVPTVIYDPRIPPNRRVRRQDATVLNTDFAPTMLAMAGLPVPGDMQGQDLTPLLIGPAPQSWRDAWFYEHVYEHGGKIEPCEGVRAQRWKYIRYYRQDPVYESLFDLLEDPRETRDLARDEAYRSVLDEYRAKWRRFRHELS
jgi:arylsulfatase A-like enzyme